MPDQKLDFTQLQAATVRFRENNYRGGELKQYREAGVDDAVLLAEAFTRLVESGHIVIDAGGAYSVCENPKAAEGGGS